MKQRFELRSILIAPHIFVGDLNKVITNKPHLIQYLDGLEIFNGEQIINFQGPEYINLNQKSKKLYEQIIREYSQLGALSFSDAHTLKQIGSSSTTIKDFDQTNKTYFINNLRKKIKETDLNSDHNQKLALTEATQHIYKKGLNKLLNILKK